jgi:hypothetical protein
MEEMINDFLINASTYGSMLWAFGKRHPKIVLIFGLLLYSTICLIHLVLYSNSKPFFSLSVIVAVFVALPLIVLLFKNEEVQLQRISQITAESDWFAND